MLIEIPDPVAILGVIVSFFVGLGGLFAYYRLRPMIKASEVNDSSEKERLEYYERQLIDMKIRLDSLELEGFSEQKENHNEELKQLLENFAKNQINETVPKPPSNSTNVPEKRENTPSILEIDTNNPIDYVLHLITTKPMTSRDIQITLKKSREHTSRLMKKLFDEGYVDRNTESKPYSYSISNKGKEKIGILEAIPPSV